jgi:plasmid stability protein
MHEQARKPRLTVEVDAELRRQLKIAAARHDITVREYVLTAVRQALETEDREIWSRLSEVAFARDWDSEADESPHWLG